MNLFFSKTSFIAPSPGGVGPLTIALLLENVIKAHLIREIDMNVIFIGGKQIGVNCLKVLLENDIHPSIVIGNRDDHGLDFEWHESVIKVAQKIN